MQKSLVITGVVFGFLLLGAFNEAICIADLAPGEVSILARLKRAIPDAVAGFEGVAWIDGEAITMPLQTVKAGAEGQLVINFKLPIGYKLNPAAPIDYAVHVRGHSLQVSNSGRSLSAHAIELPLTIPFQTSAGTHRVDLVIEATFYWCREDTTGVCLIQSAYWHVPVETSETDANRILSVSTTAEPSPDQPSRNSKPPATSAPLPRFVRRVTGSAGDLSAPWEWDLFQAATSEERYWHASCYSTKLCESATHRMQRRRST